MRAATMKTVGIGMTSVRTRDRLLARLQAQGIHDQRVLSAIRETPRHLFMQEALASRAYEDTALPIGNGQTISQPYVVALMTQRLLRNETPKKVLEVGTGSGYQAAILSRIVGSVFTVERVEALFWSARKLFKHLGYRNIRSRYLDGFDGWPEQAPFDAIVITAAAPELPKLLLSQLAPGGVLVSPVAGGGSQQLLAVEMQDGEQVVENLGAVVFVPMLAGIQDKKR